MKRLGIAVLLLLLIPLSVFLYERLLDSDKAGPIHAAEPAAATDLEVPAGAVTLRLERRSVDRQTRRGDLGTRWRHNWETRLLRAGNVIRIEEWTGEIVFDQVGDTSGYESPSGERIEFTAAGAAVRRSATGIAETFDESGRLLERIYRADSKQPSRVSLRYDDQGRLARVEGAAGSSFEFVRDTQGRVIRVTSSTGAALVYAYDGDDLTEVQINGAAPWRYRYNRDGALTRVEDPQAGALDIAYDRRGRTKSYRWADGSKQYFEHDDSDGITRLIAADKGATSVQESSDQRRTVVTDPLGNKTVVERDAAGRPIKLTGPTGATVRLNRDPAGRMLSSEDAAGNVTHYEYAGETEVITAIVAPDGTHQEYEYDGDKNLTAVKTGGKTNIAITYNPDGTIASTQTPETGLQKFTYYPNGLVASVANAPGETTKYEYDARGNLLRETNPLGGVTVRAYDPQDRLTSLTLASGETTRYEYDAKGRMLREIGAGGATTFEYDARGRLAAETDPAGQVTRYEYTPTEQIAKIIWPGKRTETRRYDKAGNLTEQTNALGLTTKYEYDPAGRLTREKWSSGLDVRYRYDAIGNLIATEDNADLKLSYQVDALGQAIAQTDQAGGTVKYQYDLLGQLSALTDPLGEVKRYEYGADAELIQVTEASRDSARYEYNQAGQLVAVRRPSGGTTRYSYDKAGNLLTETDPLGNMKRYYYDDGGRLRSAADADEEVTGYFYDAAGRLSEKQFPDGKRVTYQYDALGRMTSADDGAFPVRMSYDEIGNLRQVEYVAIKQTITYDYDAQGLRTRMTAPGGRETRYRYNKLKQLSAVVLPDGDTIAFEYDLKDRLLSASYPNGVTGRWSYDANGRITGIAYTDKNRKPLAGTSYRFDLAGNPVERQDVHAPASRFAYDAAGQLVEETSGADSTKYRYAAGGNRSAVETAGRTRTYKHNAADQITEAGDEKLTYDANGNLTRRAGPDGTTIYEYDAENHLTKVVEANGATTTFGYAPTGERVWRKDKAGLTWFIHDGPNLLAELGEDLQTKSTFVHGFGIDRPLAMLQGEQTYYYLADRMGSITHLTDSKGQIASTYRYDAFGKIKTKIGTIANPFAYTGRELDPTGLHYYRARYYDAELGRFLSKDLIGARLDEPLEQNSYLYVRNNPVRFVDPLGLDFLSPEYLQSQSPEDLLYLFKALNQLAREGVASAAQDVGKIHQMLNARGVPGGATLDALYGSGQPAPRTPGPSARPGGTTAVGAGGGSPGRAGANTGAVRPGGNTAVGAAGPSPGRAGANTGAVPQPGPAGGRTIQMGEPPPRGNTLVGPAVPGTGTAPGFWSLDPSSIRPGLLNVGTGASVIAGAVDCYRRTISECWPTVATGIVAGGIVKTAGIVAIQRGASAAAVAAGTAAAGTVLTLVAGARGWWQVGKERVKNTADLEQREAQAKARAAQEQVNLQNRDAFYGRIDKLRAKINALKPIQEQLDSGRATAEKQAEIAYAASVDAHRNLAKMRHIKDQKEQTLTAICADIYLAGPATLKSEIDALAAEAEGKQRESYQLLREAQSLAANCTSRDDAQGIRTRVTRIRLLPGQITPLKSAAAQKASVLDKLREKVAKIKLGEIRSLQAEIGTKWSAADNSVREATRLVKLIRDSMAKLDSGEKSLRREINALHSAVPEEVLADIQDRFNELHGLLSNFTTYRPLDRNYHDEATEYLKRTAMDLDAASTMQREWKVTFPCDADIPSAEAAIGRIDAARAAAEANADAAADPLGQALLCDDPEVTPEEVTVPDVTVFDSGSEIIALLNHAGLKASFGQPQQAPSKALEGKIVQNPTAGSKVPKDSTVTVMRYIKPSDEVTVPPLPKSYTGSQVIGELSNVGLVAKFSKSQSAPSKDLENEIFTDPGAGTRVQRGSTVVVMRYGKFEQADSPATPETPSTPETSDLVTVPPLPKSYTGSQVISALGNVGLTASFQKSQSAPSKDLENEIFTDPGAGTRVQRGSTVVVMRYGKFEPKDDAGTPVPTVPEDPAVKAGGVPNVIGDSLERAQARLEAAGLRVSGITRGGKPPTPDQAGRVYFQSPVGGSPLPANKNVVLKQYDKEDQAPAVGGVGVCQTSAGPIGCTGSFPADYTADCDGQDRFAGQAMLMLHPDGMTEFAGAAGTKGKMDANGRVSVESADEWTVSRWEAQYSRVPAGGGATKAAGGGRSYTKTTAGTTVVVCTGTFVVR